MSHKAAPQPVPIAPAQAQDDSVDYPEPEPSDETLPADQPQTEEKQMDDTILNIIVLEISTFFFVDYPNFSVLGIYVRK